MITSSAVQAFGNAAMILASGKKGNRFALPHSRIMTAPPRINRSFGSTSNIMIKANELEYNTQTYVEFLSKYTGEQDLYRSDLCVLFEQVHRGRYSLPRSMHIFCPDRHLITRCSSCNMNFRGSSNTSEAQRRVCLDTACEGCSFYKNGCLLCRPGEGGGEERRGAQSLLHARAGHRVSLAKPVLSRSCDSHSKHPHSVALQVRVWLIVSVGLSQACTAVPERLGQSCPPPKEQARKVLTGKQQVPPSWHMSCNSAWCGCAGGVLALCPCYSRGAAAIQRHAY